MRHFLPILVFFSLSCATLSQGENRIFNISDKDEYAIGRLTAAKILEKYRILRNDEATEYLNTMVNYLALYSKRPYIYKGYHAGILNSSKPIVLSAPGGFIFISKGMIKRLDNEDQLAAIIAHEIGHIVKKHGLSFVKTARLIDLTARTTQTILNKKVQNERKRKIAKVGVELTETLLKRGYSREQEEEADAEAIDILTKAGYNPYALVQVLLKFQGKSSKIQFLRTHPYPEKRAAILKKYVRSSQVKELRTHRFMLIRNSL